MPGRQTRVVMSDQQSRYRELPVQGGLVPCLPGKEETVDHCRFCAHCREFLVGNDWVRSPSLAYCPTGGEVRAVDLRRVGAVRCADRRGEGYRSMMNVIG